MRAPLLKSFLIALLLLPAGGCASAIMSAPSFLQTSKTNIKESSYAAADMLIQQSRAYVSSDTPIKLGALTDIDNPAERTAFGRVITGQIAARYVQLGYNITAQDMGMGAGMGAAGSAPVVDATLPPADMPPQSAVAPSSSYTGGSQPMITGQYAVARREVLVNLRVMDMASGRVLGAYDYSVPLDSDIRELTRSQADKGSFFSF